MFFRLLVGPRDGTGRRVTCGTVPNCCELVESIQNRFGAVLIAKLPLQRFVKVAIWSLGPGFTGDRHLFLEHKIRGGSLKLRHVTFRLEFSFPLVCASTTGVFRATKGTVTQSRGMVSLTHRPGQCGVSPKCCFF